MPKGVYERKIPDPIERFWSYVDKTGEHWLWTGGTDRHGYGQFFMDAEHRHEAAHRVSYELAYGPIPNGENVLHRCDIALCVKPMCLYLGSKLQNFIDWLKRGRKSNKLTQELADEIRSLYATGKYTQSVLGLRYGITGPHVSDIVNNRRWPIVK